MNTRWALEIDGAGKFLIPGLFDMHAHFFYEQGNNENTCEDELKVMIANGLTTARIICGDPVYLETRDKISAGDWVGPELVVTSPQFVGRWPWPGKTTGSIARGKQADFILLDKDPLVDIQNTRTIHTVFKGAKVFPRGTLDAMLDDARARLSR